MAGGIANAGAVTRDGDHVLRPSNPHTPTIHAFLRFLREEGFTGASNPIGVDPDGRERLEYIAGDVAVPPYPAWAQTDMALATAAALLRRLHDVSARYVPPPDATWSVEMADPAGGAVICHNDVCLENIVYRDQVAVGLLDFDFAAPGRRVHDLASFARMCVPMDADDDAVLLGRSRRSIRSAGCGSLPMHTALRRIDTSSSMPSPTASPRGGQFLQRRLDEGNEAFIKMVAESGGMAKFDRRRAWFAANRQRFADALG